MFDPVSLWMNEKRLWPTEAPSLADYIQQLRDSNKIPNFIKRGSLANLADLFPVQKEKTNDHVQMMYYM